MKKGLLFICLCLCVFLLFGCSSSTPTTVNPTEVPTEVPTEAPTPFTLRNNILFGDTIDIVKSKEQLPLKDEAEDKTSITFKGSIASYNGEVQFYFDKDTGKLTDMEYSFSESDNSASMDTVYASLKEGIIKKYGNPLGLTGGKTHSVIGKAFDTAGSMIAFTQVVTKKRADLIDYDEWLVPCTDGAIKIDLVEYYYTITDNKYTETLLSYHFTSIEEMENIIQEKQEKQDAIDDAV